MVVGCWLLGVRWTAPSICSTPMEYAPGGSSPSKRPRWAGGGSNNSTPVAPRMPAAGEKPLDVTLCIRKAEKYLEYSHDYNVGGELFTSVIAVLTLSLIHI